MWLTGASHVTHTWVMTRVWVSHHHTRAGDREWMEARHWAKCSMQSEEGRIKMIKAQTLQNCNGLCGYVMTRYIHKGGIFHKFIVLESTVISYPTAAFFHWRSCSIAPRPVQGSDILRLIEGTIIVMIIVMLHTLFFSQWLSRVVNCCS